MFPRDSPLLTPRDPKGAFWLVCPPAMTEGRVRSPPSPGAQPYDLPTSPRRAVPLHAGHTLPHAQRDREASRPFSRSVG